MDKRHDAAVMVQYPVRGAARCQILLLPPSGSCGSLEGWSFSWPSASSWPHATQPIKRPSGLANPG